MLPLYLGFRVSIADTASSFVITQSIISCRCILLLGFHLLPDHVWLHLVPYSMYGWVYSGELARELKYSCHSCCEIVVSSAADLVVFLPVLIFCQNAWEFQHLVCQYCSLLNALF